MEKWYLGTIGFSYKDWMGSFYPMGTTQRGYLPYYSKIFNSVEIDTTFHAIPRTTSVLSWAVNTPSNFKFSLKTPRRITHELGLQDANSLMDEFLETLLPLGEKLGPILIQLPPKFTQDHLSVLSKFLDSLPKTFRFAVEFRHPSWYNDKTSDLLSSHQVCWVAIDYPNLPTGIFLTTSFIYIRWIGINNLYHHHSYERIDKTDQLKRWLDITYEASGNENEIYGYFNNDYAGFAAGTCQRFKDIAGLSKEGEKIPHQDRFI